MHEGVHSLHLRKRIYEKKEPYPHPDKFKRTIDNSIIFVGIFAQLMTIPQIIKIWFEKNATGVSIFPWIAYLIYAIFFLFYGLVHREKQIIIIYILWILLNLIIVIGILIYG